MTKKDYELIASTIKESIDFYTEWGGSMDERARARTAVARVAKQLSNSLSDANPRFDRERFLTACGVND